MSGATGEQERMMPGAKSTGEQGVTPPAEDSVSVSMPRETPFFFNGSSGRLFGVTHDPVSVAGNVGFLMLYPLPRRSSGRKE